MLPAGYMAIYTLVKVEPDLTINHAKSYVAKNQGDREPTGGKSSGRQREATGGNRDRAASEATGSQRKAKAMGSNGKKREATGGNRDGAESEATGHTGQF